MSAATQGDSRQVQALVIGAGQRGNVYAQYARDAPEKLKVIGIVETRQYQREVFKKRHAIPDENVFTDWKEAERRTKFADCVFICTPDRTHKEIAIAFAKKGYHILIEKPMAVTYEDCVEVVNTCEENDVFLAVCHVLRYTPQARKIRDVIQSGAIGDVVNIQLLEPVGYYHFAHSYVRGNWRNSGTSSFSLLTKSCHDIDLVLYWMSHTKCKSVSSFGSLKHFTHRNKVGYYHFAHSFVRGNWCKTETSTFSLLSKSCHDIDLLQFWMAPRKCTQISSFGSLKHFKPQNKPPGAGNRCLDCSVERSCPYSAKKLYIDNEIAVGRPGFSRVITDIQDIENVTEALRTGPYGRCVYDCDNDVCDNQVVNMQFEDGATASFTMVAFTEKVCSRQARIFGTKGELKCDFDYLKVDIFDFSVHEPDYYDLRNDGTNAAKSSLKGHGGADFHAVDAFVKAVAENDRSFILTGPGETLESHRLCFLAEKSRLQKEVVQV